MRKELTLPNAPGTIDADYPDEWLVMVRNSGARPARIEHGERIAQVVLARSLNGRDGAAVNHVLTARD